MTDPSTPATEPAPTPEPAQPSGYVLISNDTAPSPWRRTPNPPTHWNGK